MLTLVEFLEELERNHQAVTVPADELEHLVRRFGDRVRQMGRWSHTTDGSLEIPMGNIAAAARTLGDRQLTEAVGQLKNLGQFTDMLNGSSAAARLIEVVSLLYLRQFEQRVVRYQESTDPSEVERLRHDISRELFGE
jgi:hypothetical protein